MTIMQEQSRKVALPGSMFERAGQWWWQVRLPGEDAVQTHLVRTPDDGTAVCNPEIAEKAAVQMWEQALVRETTARILFDCTQRVERFKTHFLDELDRLTKMVESATAKARAEADARAEIESKLNAIIQAAGLEAGDVGHKATATSPEGWNLPADLRAAASGPAATEGNQTRAEVGPCECCGRTDLPAMNFKQIDSGQWLCPDCLHTLQVNALQAELDSLTASLA